MTTPFSTPRYPGAPNPTPRSTGKLPRAPIHNPYDKFTQPEFDAWIGDITGARDAEEEDLEDSFADVRARRLAKGKERARDEDFEDEEPVSHHYGDENGWGETYSGPDYSSDAEEEEESSEEEESPEEREPVVIDLLSDDEDAEGEEQDSDVSEPEGAVAGPAPAYDEEEDDSGYDEEVAEEAVAEGEVVEDDIIEDDAEGEDVEEVDAAFEGQYEDDEDDEDDVDEDPRSSPAAAREVTEILDSDDEVPQEEPVAEIPTIPARFRRKSGIGAPVHANVGEDQETGRAEGDEEQAEEQTEEQDEEQAGVLSPRVRDEAEVDIEDPWQGPRTYAEDFYAGGDVPREVLNRAGDPHVLPTEKENDDSAQPPDIHDPWEGPRMYAEDFYSGGDVLEGGTPSHLTPREEEPLDIPGISSARDEPSRSIRHDQDVVNLDEDDRLLTAEEPRTSPGVQPTTERDDELDYADQPEAAQEVIAETPRSPSPPSPTLRTQVDWNWPPAFPGRVATSSGHLATGQDGIVEISDDEDDDVTPPEDGQPELAVRDAISADDIPFGTTASASPTSMPFSLGFDELYDMESGSHPYTSFEPVASGADFGDLPPSREEQVQSSADETLPATTEDTVKVVEEPGEDVEAAQEPPSAIAPEEVPTMEGFVEEVDEIKEVTPPSEEEIDVVSATGDDIAVSLSDYVVEEVATEGRFTAELEPSMGGDELPAEDGSPVPPTLALDTSDVSLTEYPAPVSADPTVPDPTSIVHTPASPVDSIASSSGDKEPPALAAHPCRSTSCIQETGAFSQREWSIHADDRGHVGFCYARAEHDVEQELSQSEAVMLPPEIEITPVEEKTAPESDEIPALDVPSTEEVQPVEEELTLPHIVEPEKEAPATASPHGKQGHQREKTPASDADADAEGEVDLDYVPSEGDEDAAAAAVEAVIPAVSEEVEDDPFVIKKVVDIPAEPVAVEEDGKASLPSPVETETAANEPTEPEVVMEAQPVAPPPVEAEAQDEARPLKRKRKSPPPKSSRVTRSKVAKRSGAPVAPKTQPAPKSRKGRGKGKQRASPETDDEEDTASVTHSLSRATSRASSVVSNGLSMSSEASPTIARALQSNGNHNMSLPFIPYNGVLRHNHGGRIPTYVAPVPPPRRQPSLPPPPPPVPPSPRDSIASSRPGSPELASISAPPQIQIPATRPAATSSTTVHSPATRSNCRYHTISLPIEEESEHRVYFAVPGCSLSNTELVQEAEIEDHGLTRTEELPTTITLIEDLKISPELLAILRQLTGVDLFREQEVIYLPRPGDQIVPKKKRSRAKYIQRESITSRTLLTKDVFRAKQTPYKAPLSQASVSASTSGESASASASGAGKAGMSTSGASFSGSDLSDIESDDERPTKRAKEAHPKPEPAPVPEMEPEDEPVADAAADAGGDTEPDEAQIEVELSQDRDGQANGKADSAASPTARRAQPRRGRKLKKDALAYKPDGGESDGSDEEHDAEGPKKRKRPAKRGNKRARAEDNGDAAQAEEGGAAAAERPKRRRRGEKAASTALVDAGEGAH
uniref:Alcohol oxidase n=1 Tax=Ganoderma boninense TaxID=34458 RepID=A0A5K1K689_9APHY|nr:Alcohol oxidase [Ganoderma boninense]